jgi:hypothetical protein
MMVCGCVVWMGKMVRGDVCGGGGDVAAPLACAYQTLYPAVGRTAFAEAECLAWVGRALRPPASPRLARHPPMAGRMAVIYPGGRLCYLLLLLLLHLHTLPSRIPHRPTIPPEDGRDPCRDTQRVAPLATGDTHPWTESRQIHITR